MSSPSTSGNSIESTKGLKREAALPADEDVQRQASTIPGFAGNPQGKQNAGPSKREFKEEQDPNETDDNIRAMKECSAVLSLIIAKQVYRAYLVASSNINYVIDYGESIPGTIEDRAEEQYKNLGSEIFSGSYSWSTFFCQIQNTFLPQNSQSSWAVMKGLMGVLFAFQPELKPQIVNDLNDEISERIEHLKSKIDEFVNDYTSIIDGVDSGPSLSPENDPTTEINQDDIKVEQDIKNIPNEETNKGILDKISEAIEVLEGFDPEEENEKISDISEQIDIIGRCLEFSQRRKDPQTNFPNSSSDGIPDEEDEIAQNYEQIDKDLARRINNKNLSADELKDALKELRGELEDMGKDRTVECITVIVPEGTIFQSELQGTLFEDIDGDSNAENTKDVILEEGENCFGLEGLDGSEGNDYWLNWEDQNGNNHTSNGQKTEEEPPNMQYGGEPLFGDNQKLKLLKNLRDQVKNLIVLLSSLKSDITDIIQNYPSLVDPLNNMEFFDGLSLKLSEELQNISVDLEEAGTSKKDDAIESLKNTEIMIAALGNLNKDLGEFSDKFKEDLANEWSGEVEELQNEMQEDMKEFIDSNVSGKWRSSFDEIIFKLNSLHNILDSIVKGNKFDYDGYQSERLDKMIANLQKDLESVLQALDGLSMLQSIVNFNNKFNLDNMLKDTSKQLKTQAKATKKQINNMIESLNGRGSGGLGKDGFSSMFGQSANAASCIDIIKSSTRFIKESLVDPSAETMAKVSSFLEDTSAMIESWLPDFPPESWTKSCENNESLISELQELRKNVRKEAEDVFNIFKAPEPPKSPAQRRRERREEQREPEEVEVNEQNTDEFPSSPGSGLA